MDNANKRAKKQFQLVDKNSCLVYLQRIIVMAEKCFYKFRRYNDETLRVLKQYKGSETVPFDLYIELADKTASVSDYLLNIIGDAQSSSISYFKFRKQVERLVRGNTPGVTLQPFSAEIEALIVDFNKMRNWQNHIPESLLTCEQELISSGKIVPYAVNPIGVYVYEKVAYRYVDDLYQSNCAFYDAARKIIQASKRDYSGLIGEAVEIRKIYSDSIVDLEMLEASKLSAQIQGIKGCV